MWYDVVVLAILVFAVVRGAAKGIVWQLAVIASLLLCFAFSESLSLAIAPAIKVAPPLNRWIAMFVLYVAFSFVSFGAARGLRSWIEKAKFVEYDRHLGAIFGFVKGAVVCLFITFFGVTLSAGVRDQILRSYSGYAAAIVMDRLHPVMPKELHKVLDPYIHQLDRPGMDLRYADHDEHEHHDHPHVEAPRSGPSSPVRRTPRDTTPVPPDNADPFGGDGWFGLGGDEIEDQLPRSLDSELRDLAIEALRRASPDDRDELLEKIRTGAPNVIRAAAAEWLGDAAEPIPTRPTTDPRTPAPAEPVRPAANRSAQETLLREIAEIYADSPQDQQRFIDEQELLLTGLPARVELAVLEDWHADVFSLDGENDPDADTNVRTPTETRIVRQLSRARVPLSSLSSDLQSRLRGVRTR